MTEVRSRFLLPPYLSASTVWRTTSAQPGPQAQPWALFSLIPIVPFLYVLTGGDLW